MLTLEIPGRETIAVDHLVSDFNGTLAVDGHLQAGVIERVVRISKLLAVHILTADSHGTAAESAKAVEEACAAAHVASPNWERVRIGSEKEQYVRRLGDKVVTLGNGANDEAMFRAAALSICVLGTEGTFMPALLAAHVAVTSPLDSLDALLLSKRMIGTLRP
jgi:soluble P-type ATPase